MKKFLYICATALTMTGMLVSCEEDPYIPNPDMPSRSYGAYVLNQGQSYEHVPGGLYAISYDGNTIIPEAFQKANSISLGDSPQCGISYGSKLYIGVYESNCIFICDKNTFKITESIRLQGEIPGQGPRSMVATGGKVYVAMYDGYVARIDTVSAVIDNVVKVGPNPEIMALYNNKLYVPNSDGVNYPNYGKTASVVNLESFTVSATITVPENPYKFAANRSGLYLLAQGNYNDVPSKVYKIDGEKCTEIAEATIMEVSDDMVYMINTPFYGSTQPQYLVYNTTDNELKEWDIQKVDYPSNIAVDNISGKIFISSYVMDGIYPSYKVPGYINEYTINNVFVRKYDIGVGPTCIFFDHE